MCSLDLVTVYLQNNQEHRCDKIFIGSFREDASPMTRQGTKIADLICLVIDFRFLLNLLEKGENKIKSCFLALARL